MKTAVLMALRAIKCRSGVTVVRALILAALLPSLSLYSITFHKVGNVLGRKPSASTDLDTSQLAACDTLLNSPSTDTEDVGGLGGVKQFKRHFRAADMR